MDSLPYFDRPNDEEYEAYALSLIQKEMDRRQAPPKPPPISETAGPELSPTGNTLSESKLPPLSDASSLEDHTIALQRAKRNYESERLRHLQLSTASELEYKHYNDHVTFSGWPTAATTQQTIVDEVNYGRKMFQQKVLAPQLESVERQYQELVQKNLQLRSAILDLQRQGDLAAPPQSS